MPSPMIPGEDYPWSADEVFGPEIRQIFRRVSVAPFGGGVRAPYAQMLSDRRST
jgi:hypothetical protein